MTKQIMRAGFCATLAVAGMDAAPADAQVEKMGPVSATIVNCGDRVTINVLTLVCASPYKCDYAVGVNNYSGGPISYTVAVDAPQNYTVYTHGPHTSKGYEALKVVQAPQASNGPPVKVALTCTRAASAAPASR